MLALKDLVSGMKWPPTSADVLLKGPNIVALSPRGQFKSNSVLLSSLSQNYRSILGSQRPKWLKNFLTRTGISTTTPLTGVPPAFVWILTSLTVSPLHIWTALIVTSFTSLCCNEIWLPGLSPHLSLFCPLEVCRMCLIRLQHDSSLDIWRQLSDPLP